MSQDQIAADLGKKIVAACRRSCKVRSTSHKLSGCDHPQSLR